MSGKIRRLSGWNTASIFRMLFQCFPTGTGRPFLTWVPSPHPKLNLFGYVYAGQQEKTPSVQIKSETEKKQEE